MGLQKLHGVLAQRDIPPILNLSTVLVGFAAQHAIAELIGIAFRGFLAEDLEALFLFVVIFRPQGVILALDSAAAPDGLVGG